MRQHSPSTSAPVEIEDAVDNLSQIDAARPPAKFGRRQQGRDDLPLLVGEVAGIGNADAPTARFWRTLLLHCDMGFVLGCENSCNQRYYAT